MKGMKLTSLVFVYGTLKKGFGNHQLLEQSDFLARAFITRTKLLNLGAFPAVIVGGRKEVEGELYEVNSKTLERLDRLEGHPSFYERRKVLVYPLDFGLPPVPAWCYFLSKASQAHYEKLCPVIETGIWNGHRA